MRTTGSARAVAPCAQHRAGEFDAFDELLAQHVGVVLRRQLHRVLHLRIARDPGDADRRTLARRLHDQAAGPACPAPQPHPSRAWRPGSSHTQRRGRQALGQPHALGHHLVHGDGAKPSRPSRCRGCPAVPSAPCTVPSSPWRPCSAMKARAIAFALEIGRAHARPGRRRARPRPATAAPPARRCRTSATPGARRCCRPSGPPPCPAPWTSWFIAPPPTSSANASGTPPMEPAPIVITTSPPRAAARIASGSAATSSTNTTSTRPGRPQRPRQVAAVGAGDRRFARGIDLGHQHGVEALQDGHEVARSSRACGCSGAAGRPAPVAGPGRRRAPRRARRPSPPGGGRSRRSA